MRFHVHDDHSTLSEAVASSIATWINGNPGALLCLAAGDTPLDAYRRLIEMQQQRLVNLASVYYVGLDEWVGLGYDDRGSCIQVMRDAFYAPAGIPGQRIVVFDGFGDPGRECARVGEWIARHGGIDLTVLGVGMNGHIGFNEPDDIGSEDAPCHVAQLDETTRRVSAKYFGEPRAVAQGMTVSISALKQTAKVILMAGARETAPITARLSSTVPTPALPVSLLRDHPDIEVLLDRAAAGR